MFCDKNLDHKINILYESALWIAYNDYKASFEKLLEKDGSVNIHQRDLRCLATEMFKIKKKLSPPFIWDLVNKSNVPHYTRSHQNITETEDGNLKIEKKVLWKCHQLRK